MAPDPAAEEGAKADAEAAAEEAPAADEAATEEPDEPDDPDEDKPKKKKRSFWRDLGVIVVAALVLTILLKAFVVQVFSIPSGSMETTLLPGDHILVSKIVYKFRSIARGDVVVSPAPARGTRRSSRRATGSPGRGARRSTWWASPRPAPTTSSA
jgi:hypothetical protein